LVHDWLTGMRGGEKVLEVLCGLFPCADVFTLFHFKGTVSSVIESMTIHTSFLQKALLVERFYRYYLPFFPYAIEQFDMTDYKLIISTSHCVAKGVIPPPDAYHLNYCFTPMRYVWDVFHDYFAYRKGNRIKSLSAKVFATHLRQWDIAASHRVDRFVAISEYVARRIKKYYRRDADIVYPPVDTDFYTPGPSKDSDFYLMVSALVPYKRVDIAVKAFNRLGYPLCIIGTGPEKGKLEKMARSNIKFVGFVEDCNLRAYYRRCQALIFPGKEDFGISPVEAQACGKPVIAYDDGGARETVIHDVTGILFQAQDDMSLAEAVEKSRHTEFDPEVMTSNAHKFSTSVFIERFKKLIMSEHTSL
jgi:glycosyltransferase involved in cell wall biosynthesis